MLDLRLSHILAQGEGALSAGYLSLNRIGSTVKLLGTGLEVLAKSSLRRSLYLSGTATFSVLSTFSALASCLIFASPILKHKILSSRKLPEIVHLGKKRRRKRQRLIAIQSCTCGRGGRMLTDMRIIMAI